MRLAAATFALVLLAATPLHSDTSLGYWYESLTRNGGGGSWPRRASTSSKLPSRA